MTIDFIGALALGWVVAEVADHIYWQYLRGYNDVQRSGILYTDKKEFHV